MKRIPMLAWGVAAVLALLNAYLVAAPPASSGRRGDSTPVTARPPASEGKKTPEGTSRTSRPFPDFESAVGRTGRVFRRTRFALPDPQLEFRLLVHRGWRLVALPVFGARLSDLNVPLPLGRCESPGAGRRVAVVDVFLVRIPREIDLRVWCRYFVRGNGLEGLAYRASNRLEGNIYDVLASGRADRMRQVFRIVFHRDGDRLFVIQARSPEDVYDRHADAIAVSVLSFEPSRPSGKKYSEPLAEVESPGPAGASFRYPASWRKVAPVDRTQGLWGVDLHLRGALGRSVAWLRIKRVLRASRPDLDPKKLIVDFTREMRSQGLRMQTKDPKASPLSTRGFGRGLFMLLDAADGERRRYQGRIAVFAEPRALYSVSLVNPVVSEDLGTWLVAHRAYQIVLDSLRPRP